MRVWGLSAGLGAVWLASMCTCVTVCVCVCVCLSAGPGAVWLASMCTCCPVASMRFSCQRQCRHSRPGLPQTQTTQ